MRICMGVDFQFPGTTGSPLHSMEIARAYMDARDFVFVVRYEGIRSVACRKDVWKGIPVYHIAAIWWLPVVAWLLLKNRIDVIHTQGDLSASLLWPAAFMFSVPIVLEVHAVEELIDSFPPGEERSLGRRLRFRLNRSLLPRYDAIILLSEKERLKLMHHYKIPDGRPHVIYPPVDVGTFSPKNDLDSAQANPYPVITYAGNFFTWQGIDLLIEAMPAVWAKWPEAGFLLLGALPDEAVLYKSRLPVKERGKVDVRGKVPYEKVVDILRSSDILVIPRPNHPLNSTTSRKLGEYLAIGGLVVVTDVADHLRLVRESGAGIVTDPNAAAFADGLCEAIGMLVDGRAAKIRKAARAAALKFFDLPVTIGSRGALLRQVVTRRQSGQIKVDNNA